MRIIKNAFWIVVSMTWIALATVPTVTRHFSSTRVGPGSAIRVTLDVAAPENSEFSPKVWLLTESWSPGWTIQEAQWNDQSYPPITLASQSACGWLFGDSGAPPVGDGTLTYILLAPTEFATSATMNTASGAVFSYNASHYINGVETLYPDEYAQIQKFAVAIPSGWSLMALPFELDDFSRETLEGISDAVVEFDGKAFSFVQNGLPSMGMPFWLHNPMDEEIVGEFVAVVLEEIPTPLRAAGPVRHQQWNLFGVCGDDPVRLADGVVAWRWRGRHYECCEENAILQPGDAVWLWVE